MVSLGFGSWPWAITQNTGDLPRAAAIAENLVYDLTGALFPAFCSAPVTIRQSQ